MKYIARAFSVSFAVISDILRLKKKKCKYYWSLWNLCSDSQVILSTGASNTFFLNKDSSWCSEMAEYDFSGWDEICAILCLCSLVIKPKPPCLLLHNMLPVKFWATDPVSCFTSRTSREQSLVQERFLTTCKMFCYCKTKELCQLMNTTHENEQKCFSSTFPPCECVKFNLILCQRTDSTGTWTPCIWLRIEWAMYPMCHNLLHHRASTEKESLVRETSSMYTR